jgi:glutathione S-transferase
MKLYDLAGADAELRFSPFCWRIKMALAHKGLSVETIPWRFTEKSALPPPNAGQVPVLVDGERVIADSWKIAGYLDQRYPDRPLFEGAQAKAQALLIKFWVEGSIHPLFARLLVPGIFGILDARDKPYFQETREKRFGMPLEQLATQSEQSLRTLREGLGPLRAMLAEQPFVAGQAPGFSDYIVFAPLQWARCSSSMTLLESDDPVFAYRERMLDLHDGFARKAACASS